MDVLKARAKAKAGKQKSPEAEKPAVETPAAPVVSAPPAPIEPKPVTAPADSTPVEKIAEKSVEKTAAKVVPKPPTELVPVLAAKDKAADANRAEEMHSGEKHGLDLPELPPEEIVDEPSGGPNEEEQFLHSYAAQAARQADSLKYLTFDVGGECYGLLLTDVRETIKLPQITEVPRSPTYLKGLISLRGTMIPIVDLRYRLLLNTPELTRHSRIVICEHESALVGFVVDRVLKVVDVSGGDIQAPPATLSPEEQEVIEGVGRFRTGVVQAESVVEEAAEDAVVPENTRSAVEFFTLLRIPRLARIEFRGSQR